MHITTPKTPAPITRKTVEISVKSAKMIATAKIVKEAIFLIFLPHNPTIVLNIKTQTAILMPLKACWTIANSEKLEIKLAMAAIMIKDGEITPSVETIPPKTPFK